jgi:hypothetical protein
MSCRSYRIGLQRGQSVLTFCAVKLDRAVFRGLTQIRPFEEMDAYEVLHRMRLGSANCPE